jgi:hypothetical protein
MGIAPASPELPVIRCRAGLAHGALLRFLSRIIQKACV